MKFTEYLKEVKKIKKCRQLMKLINELCKAYNESPTKCADCPAYLYSRDDAMYFCAQSRVLKQANKVWLGIDEHVEEDEDEDLDDDSDHLREIYAVAESEPGYLEKGD